MFIFKCQNCENIQTGDDPSDIHICDVCGKIDIKLAEADLYHYTFARQIAIMEQELQRREQNDPVSVTFRWKTKQGQVFKLHEMTTGHIINCINMLRRKELEVIENPLKPNMYECPFCAAQIAKDFVLKNEREQHVYFKDREFPNRPFNQYVTTFECPCCKNEFIINRRDI